MMGNITFCIIALYCQCFKQRGST